MYKPDNVCNAAACRSQVDDLAPVFTGSAQRINYTILIPQDIVAVKGCILSKTQRERRIFAHVDMKEEQSLPAMWPTIYRLRHRANEFRPITWQADCLSRCYEKAGRLVSSINIERGRKIFAHVVRWGVKFVNQ